MIQSGQGLPRPGEAYDTILRFCACSANKLSSIFAQGTQEKKKEKRDEYDQMNAL